MKDLNAKKDIPLILQKLHIGKNPDILEWRPVETPPVTDDGYSHSYFVVINNKVSTALYGGTSKKWWRRGNVVNPSYWMPVPPLPKKEKEET